jgi:hypothetical protein
VSFDSCLSLRHCFINRTGRYNQLNRNCLQIGYLRSLNSVSSQFERCNTQLNHDNFSRVQRPVRFLKRQLR